MRIEEKALVSPKGIKPSKRSMRIAGVFNPGAVRLQDNRILLLARVAEMPAQAKGALRCPVIAGSGAGSLKLEKIGGESVSSIRNNAVFLRNGSCRLLALSHFRRIVLEKNGVAVESIAKGPSFTGTPQEGRYGVEDPRITKIGNSYAMAYVAVSANEGVSTCLALSKDLVHWKRQGIIFREQNKDVVIFPEKINGRFVALHRPEGTFKFSRPSMWISHSPDLVYWGKEKSIMRPRPGAWDSERVGSGTVPLKTSEGWLVIYHGARKAQGKRVYCAGAMLLGLRNPERVIARSNAREPLLAPKNTIERKGFVNNVVFPTGALMDLDGKGLLLYCGAGDTAIEVKKIPLKEVLNSMEWA